MSKISVLLDTSFLISLANASRQNHAIAKAYYKYMLENKIAIHFSTIAASEFSIKQPITEMPLRTFIALPFNIGHATESAKLWNYITRDPGDARHVIRDDMKLIGQASKEGINFILTEDAHTLYKYCERLRLDGLSCPRAIKLIDGFDISKLNADGQVDISSVLEVPLSMSDSHGESISRAIPSELVKGGHLLPSSDAERT